MHLSVIFISSQKYLNSYLYTDLDLPWQLQEVDSPKILTITTERWQACETYALEAFTPRRHPWYSLLLDDELAPGP
jgi:hypothetical protein